MSAGALYLLESAVRVTSISRLSLSPVSSLIINPQWGCGDGGINVNVVASFHLSQRSLGCTAPVPGMLGNLKDSEGDSQYDRDRQT